MHGPGLPGTHTSVTLDTQAGPGCRGRDRTEEVTVPPGGRGLQLGCSLGRFGQGEGDFSPWGRCSPGGTTHARRGACMLTRAKGSHRAAG